MRHFDPCPPPPPRRKQQHDASLPQAIQWAWELSTKVFGLPAERVWVSVYEQDDEAYAIWRDVVGVPEARIRRMGAADNFWASGPTGEGGMGRGEKAESAERRRRRRRRRRQGRSKGALERAMEKAAALCLPARPPFPSQLSNTARPRQTKQHRLPRVHTPPPRPLRPLLRALLRLPPRARRRRRRVAGGRRALHRVLQPRVHGAQPRRRRQLDAARREEHRHRHGPRAHGADRAGARRGALECW